MISRVYLFLISFDLIMKKQPHLENNPDHDSEAEAIG